MSILVAFALVASLRLARFISDNFGILYFLPVSILRRRDYLPVTGLFPVSLFGCQCAVQRLYDSMETAILTLMFDERIV